MTEWRWDGSSCVIDFTAGWSFGEPDAGLAAKGNPSALHFLFAPLEYATDRWQNVATRAELFLAKTHVLPFLGFAADR
jgi:hypothetical protein